MLKLRDGIAELIRKVATSLPRDVEDALINAHANEEEGSNSRNSLGIILESVRISRQSSRPVCQDTGMPVFYVSLPRGMSISHMEETILEAVIRATEKIPLRPNAVDTITETNSGNNTGVLYPLIYFKESPDSTLTIDLMLKGGGCENQGQTYKLPLEELNAQRDLEGVRKCVLDSVFKAQGKGCPPYTVGVAIGGAKDQVSRLAKEQLLRRLTDVNPHNVLAGLETRLMSEINSLGIGPVGFGGKTTVLGVKIAAAHRHPASYMVDVSLACWANRRGKLIW